jgi:hypothetical protein
MSGPPPLWIAVMIAAALIVALVRLALWRRAAQSGEAGPTWRFPALIGLNVLAAALLYLTLDPPDVGVRTGRLIVLAAGAPAQVVREAGDVVVALAEGPAGAEARAPDLATALRRHPDVRLIQVFGAGLTARDRDAVDRPVAFDPPALPPGLVRLTLPEPVAAGGGFTVSGAVGALSAGSVELADPSGEVVDRALVTAGASFVMRGGARAAGLAVFELRLKDSHGRLVERIEVPVEARETAPPRVIVMAGAPGPEPRFLRRWAEEAGIDLSVRLALGAGVDLAARPAPLTASTLSETDLLVIDERRWETLTGGERAAVRAATARGMGLLLRPTGPLSDATRRDWAGLGAVLTGGETLRPLTLEGEPAGRTEDARADGSGERSGEPAPELTRRDFDQGAGAAVMVSDADGTALATWRPFGAGRVGVWVVADSYALVLTGRDDRYGALWSRMFSVLARPEGEAPPRFAVLARAGERAVLCGVSENDVVTSPDSVRTRLIPDPRAGMERCAGFWPTRAGWHALTDGDGERGAVYVHPADATPSLVAAERALATLDLTHVGTQTGPAARRLTSGPSWPWALGLMAVLAGLWWLERRRPAAAVADR